MRKKNLLKSVVDEQGIQIFRNPSQVKNAILKKNQNEFVYGTQVEMFLQTSKINTVLDNKVNFKKMGQAGYESILGKVAQDTGMKYDIVKKIGEDILYAAGLAKKKYFYEDIPEDKAPNFFFETVRGNEAYQYAFLWIDCCKDITVEDKKLSLKPTNDEDARNAFQCLVRAAKDGCEEANGLLGMFYFYGVGTVIDHEKALKYLLKKGGLIKGGYTIEKQKIINRLIEEKEEEQKNRFSVVIFSILPAIFMIMTGNLISWIWLVLAIVNIAVTVFLLVLKKGNVVKRGIMSLTTVVIWLGFLIQICW